MSFSSIPMRLRPTCPLVPSFRSLSLSNRLENAAAAKTTIPKRPTSPWIRFCTANLPLMKSAQPNIKTTEIMKQLSPKWKLLSENQKNQYVSAYEKEKEIYNLKVSKIPKAALAEANQEKQEENAKKRASKLKNKAQSELTELLSSLQKPTKGAHSSYIAYFIARQPQLMKEKGISGKEAVSLLGKEWNALTDQQKLPYARKVKAASEQYKKDLETWTKKMMMMGKLEIIMEANTKLAMAKTKLKEFDA